MTKAKAPLFVYLLLDRSGSMEACRDRTIDAVNEYVNGMKLSDELDARFSLTIFDSQSIDALVKELPISQAPALTRAAYVPRASTPLLDAIGRAVADADGVALRQGEKVALVIVTDGLENASKEHTRDSVRKLLEGRQRDKNWLVSFLGANIDAFAEAAGVGVDAATTLQSNTHNLAGALHATRAMQARFVAAPAGEKIAYTESERESANKSS